ncbi:MAG: adenine phosphoribosyltransferase [Chitinophagales bacterium]
MNLVERLQSVIRDVPDFPKEGIIFKDLTPILLYPDLCQEIVDDMIANLSSVPDAIVAIESRGFWLAPLLAQKLNIPFIPLRKKGKLPAETVSTTYDLEYGQATIEIHKGHLPKGAKVMIHDDLLATGGTALAATRLVEMEGASVHSFTFIVNLDFLKGKEALTKYNMPIYASIDY